MLVAVVNRQQVHKIYNMDIVNDSIRLREIQNAIINNITFPNVYSVSPSSRQSFSK